jgi:hypothetical protein
LSRVWEKLRISGRDKAFINDGCIITVEQEVPTLLFGCVNNLAGEQKVKKSKNEF